MKEWILRYLVKFISSCLPSKGRRMIYLIMSYTLWSRCNDLQLLYNESIELNNRLHFSKSNPAIKFTVELCQILKSLPVFQKIALLDNHELKRSLIRAMPSWLQYAERKAIYQDLNYVFKDRYVHG